MKFTQVAKVWEFKRGAPNIHRASLGGIVFDRSTYGGYERSAEHKRLFRSIAEHIKKGATIEYEENKPFPDTIAKVTITHGTETREHEAGNSST